MDLVLENRRRIRDRLALALHDDICQAITAAGLALDILKLDLPTEFHPNAVGVQEMLEKTFERVRSLSQEMHPDPVKRFGFAAALERLADSTRRRYRDGSVHASIETGAGWELARASVIHDVAELALDNAVRHSKAKRISLTVQHGSLEVSDDGTGFDPGTTAPGLGQLLMRHLAKRQDFKLQMTSTPGKGTMVSLR